MNYDRLLYRAIIDVPFTLNIDKYPNLDTEDGILRMKFTEFDDIVPQGNQIGVSRDVIESKLKEYETLLDYGELQSIISHFEDNNSCVDDCYFIVKYDHLFQCSTVKDVNNNLIFEGDFIKVPDNYDDFGTFAGMIYEVFFNAGGFRMKPHRWVYDPTLKRKPRGFYLEEDGVFKIVGSYLNMVSENNKAGNLIF